MVYIQMACGLASEDTEMQATLEDKGLMPIIANIIALQVPRMLVEKTWDVECICLWLATIECILCPWLATVECIYVRGYYIYWHHLLAISQLLTLADLLYL